MRANAGIIAAIAAVIALAAVTYAVYQAHSTRDVVQALVKDTGERLRVVLEASPHEALDYAEHARAAETNVERLRGLNTARLADLADDADAFLLAAREILRRRAVMHQAQAGLDAGLEALTAHMQSDRGDADWTGKAVELKTAVDRELREFRIAAETYARLLEWLPEPRTQMSEHVEARSLVSVETISAARKHGLDVLARAEDNTKRLTTLDAYRDTRAAPARQTTPGGR